MKIWPTMNGKGPIFQSTLALILSLKTPLGNAIHGCHRVMLMNSSEKATISDHFADAKSFFSATRLGMEWNFWSPINQTCPKRRSELKDHRQWDPSTNHTTTNQRHPPGHFNPVLSNPFAPGIPNPPTGFSRDQPAALSRHSYRNIIHYHSLVCVWESICIRKPHPYSRSVSQYIYVCAVILETRYQRYQRARGREMFEILIHLAKHKLQMVCGIPRRFDNLDNIHPNVLILWLTAFLGVLIPLYHCYPTHSSSSWQGDGAN